MAVKRAVKPDYSCLKSNEISDDSSASGFYDAETLYHNEGNYNDR